PDQSRFIPIALAYLHTAYGEVGFDEVFPNIVRTVTTNNIYQDVPIYPLFRALSMLKRRSLLFAVKDALDWLQLEAEYRQQPDVLYELIQSILQVQRAWP